jgi:hypothetical protein
MLLGKRARCFYEDLDSSQSYSIVRVGLRAINVRRIVGTVDKCGEVDSRFRNIRRGDIGEFLRRAGIERSTNPYDFLPPISVLKYSGNYYVVDGHRRVAAVLSKKIDFIDAEIDEYVLQKDTSAREGVIARLRFESETGLSNINLLRDENYSSLLDEVQKFSNPDDWAKDRFFPLVRSIGNSPLAKHYQNLSGGDIYVLISLFYRDLLGEIPEEISNETVISGYLFAHKVRHYKPFRTPLLTLLFRWLR